MKEGDIYIFGLLSGRSLLGEMVEKRDDCYKVCGLLRTIEQMVKPGVVGTTIQPDRMLGLKAVEINKAGVAYTRRLDSTDKDDVELIGYYRKEIQNIKIEMSGLVSPANAGITPSILDLK